MNDRDLLELAAKAASQPGGWIENEYEGWFFWQKPGGGEWNPITDDGDALRLAVRLGMKLSTNLHHRFVTVNDEQEFYDESKFGGVCDPDGVMRRTIVRAAAEIGRQMQNGGAA